MANKTNYRARVMKYAWHIFKTLNQDFGTCLKKAWMLYRLAKEMRERVVKFYYMKADGTLRSAVGTLKNLPAGVTNGRKRITKPSYKTLTYFDVDKGAFRSFKTENLMYLC